MTAETALLGAILRDNGVFWKSGVQAKHFTNARNRILFEHVEDILGRGEVANLVTLKKSVGDMVPTDYIAQLTDADSAMGWQWAARVAKDESREAAIRRLSALIPAWFGEQKTVDGVIAEIEEVLKSVDDSVAEVSAIKTYLKPFIDDLEVRYRNQGQLPGISTGFPLLDEAFGGFEPQRLYYVGARPSKGKSAFLHNLMANVGDQKVACGLISLESSATEVIRRLFARQTKLPVGALAKGYLRQEKFGSVMDAASRMAEWPLIIADVPNAPLQVVRSVARQMVHQHKAKVLFVDYVQLVSKRIDSMPMREHVIEVSKSLKTISREMNVAVVAAAQLRRDSENRRPYLSDFGESSQLEMDADVAMLLHEDGDRYWVYIEKNRDGATDEMEVEFNKAYMEFIRRVA